MPYVEDHGGGCCGMSHIMSFHGDRFTDEHIRSEMMQIIERLKEDNEINDEVWDEEADEYVTRDEPFPWDGREFNHAFEAVLTDQQMQKYAPIMKKVGFTLLYRWLNDNSGNYCNLLVWSPMGSTDLGKLPYEW